MLALTHALALEYSKQGLRAVNVQPGGVSTALAMSTLDKMPEGYDIGDAHHHVLMRILIAARTRCSRASRLNA